MTTLDLNLDGPYSPEATLRAAAMVSEGIRYLAYATRHPEALADPADTSALIGEVALVAGRLPQLLEQVSGWLAAEEAAGRIGMAHGSRYPSVAVASEVARMGLERAQVHARMLQQSLEAVASVTSEMAARDDGDRLSIWQALLTS